MRRIARGLRERPAAVAGLCVLLAQAGCGLSKGQVPGLSGPSELGLSFEIRAQPDVLVANGYSTSAIHVIVRNENGQPRSGQDVFFALSDALGQFANIGKLSSDTATSGSNGVAQVVYTAPVRTDFTANGSVVIQARPIGTDFNGQVYREVRIELRSAEPRLFPPSSACGFTTEPPDRRIGVNQDILFQSTGNGVRYFWDFGDGAQDDKPDVVHRYGFPGEYSVVHIVTSSGGAEATCTKDVFVE